MYLSNQKNLDYLTEFYEDYLKNYLKNDHLKNIYIFSTSTVAV